jgi:hypothetical protein
LKGVFFPDWRAGKRLSAMTTPQDERRQRVLVADDDQSIRQLVATIAKRENSIIDAIRDFARGKRDRET